MARRRNKKTHCLNCNYSFNQSENYCPNCGQENHDLKIPFSHFVEEFLEGILHFDSKVWHTLKTLFFYPGKITNDFLDGKRVSFVPPIRLYVFFSFIFFLTLSLVFNHKDEDKKLTQIIAEEGKADKEEISKVFDSLEFKVNIEDSIGAKESQEIERKLRKIGSMTGGDINQLNQKVYKILSFALFFLLPVFALIMKLMYRSSHKFYYEHFIAAIHYHVIIFIILLIAIGFYAISLPSASYLILFFGALVYFINSLRAVYHQSWLRTTVKAVLIFWVYGIILLAVIVTIALVVGAKYFGF
ncbi:MAG: DUF3667 domain-containing protein [Chitinophagales bacterium]|nr:DUF3667 domain-containing protein [Chitinophagales bacterium]